MIFEYKVNEESTCFIHDNLEIFTNAHTYTLDTFTLKKNRHFNTNTLKHYYSIDAYKDKRQYFSNTLWCFYGKKFASTTFIMDLSYLHMVKFQNIFTSMIADYD